MNSFGFSHGNMLPYLPAAIFVVFCISVLWLRRRERCLRFFGTGSGRVHGRLRVVCFVCVLLLITSGLGLLLAGLYVKTSTRIDVFESLQVVLAVDISKSMLAPVSAEFSGAATHEVSLPCEPTRLRIAAREVRNFIDVIGQKAIDRVALVIFARYAYPAIPVLTSDYQLFKRRSEKEMEIDNVISMPEGSNHWYAVERSLSVFHPDDPGKKVLIILTDGEPSAPEDALLKSRIEAQKQLADMENFQMYVVGIGEPGRRLPVPRAWMDNGCPDTNRGYMVQTGGPDAGQIMTTVTDTSMLRRFADDAGATYIHSRTGQDLADTLRQITEKERSKTGVSYKETHIDLSEHLIMALLVLQAVLVALKTP